MDTGATDHMTSNLNLLVNSRPAKINMTVNLSSGAKTVAAQLRDVCLNNGLRMINVMYVLAFTHNLLSVHKLSQDKNFYVVFSPNICTIMDFNSHV